MVSATVLTLIIFPAIYALAKEIPNLRLIEKEKTQKFSRKRDLCYFCNANSIEKSGYLGATRCSKTISTA
jgi:hypothetical protein